MKKTAACERVREEIASYRAGWLDETAAAKVADHLARCPACSAELRADAWLTAALGRLPAERPAPAPIPVFHARASAARPAPLRGRFVVAAVATAVFALYLAHPAPDVTPLTTVTGPAAGQRPDAVQATPFDIDALMAAGAAAADPNRGIVLLYVARHGRAAQQ